MIVQLAEEGKGKGPGKSLNVLQMWFIAFRRIPEERVCASRSSQTV